MNPGKLPGCQYTARKTANNETDNSERHAGIVLRIWRHRSEFHPLTEQIRCSVGF